MVDDKELLELVEMEVRELLNKYKFPGDDTRSCVGSALKALEGDKTDRDAGDPAGGGDGHIPIRCGVIDKAVPDAGRGRVLDLRAAARW